MRVLPTGHVVATLSELNHSTALLAAPPPFILGEAVQRDVRGVSLLQRNTLVLLAAHRQMPRDTTVHAHAPPAIRALDAAVVGAARRARPRRQTLQRVDEHGAAGERAVDSVGIRDRPFSQGLLEGIVRGGGEERFALGAGDVVFARLLRAPHRDLRRLDLPLAVTPHTAGAELVRAFQGDHHETRLVLATDRTVVDRTVSLSSERDDAHRHLSQFRRCVHVTTWNAFQNKGFQLARVFVDPFF